MDAVGISEACEARAPFDGQFGATADDDTLDLATNQRPAISMPDAPPTMSNNYDEAIHISPHLFIQETDVDSFAATVKQHYNP